MASWISEYKDIIGVVTKAVAKSHDDHSDLTFKMQLEITSFPGVIFESKSPYRISVGETVRLFHVDIKQIEFYKKKYSKENCIIELTAIEILKDNKVIFSVTFTNDYGYRGGEIPDYCALD